MRQARTSDAYARACAALARVAIKTGLDRQRFSGTGHGRASRTLSLGRQLDLAGINIDAVSIELAGRMLFLMLALISGAIGVITFLFFPGLALPSSSFALILPFLGRELLLSRAGSAAKTRANEVLRGSPEPVNLMIMSLRREPSLSNAISFASKRDGAFSSELRRCVWEVVMGIHDDFEGALHALGQRWREYSGELKDSLSAMVTASLEGTEDGRRRALDRANSAMVNGTKRRIEEYAMSLSSPSMIMFGVGILLPLMVGSFLPMLSWNIWSLEPQSYGKSTGGQSFFETVFIMNILFPTIATLVAMSSISRHPLDNQGAHEPLSRGELVALSLLSGVSAVAVLAASQLLRGDLAPLVMLAVGALPVCFWLIKVGRSGVRSDGTADVEDVLFRAGSRMVDGENFEAALGSTATDLQKGGSTIARRLAFKTNAAGRDFGQAADEEIRATGARNAIEALGVVSDAASKDEIVAGTLAMDLAVYLRDLRELDSALRMRLKPTISMMKMTVYALGPVVLGITYAIYVTLSSMMDDGLGGLDSSAFLLVLGAFLAETDAIVCYFVWGIEGGGTVRSLMRSSGMCILTSEFVFAATALLAT